MDKHPARVHVTHRRALPACVLSSVRHVIAENSRQPLAKRPCSTALWAALWLRRGPSTHGAHTPHTLARLAARPVCLATRPRRPCALVPHTFCRTLTRVSHPSARLPHSYEFSAPQWHDFTSHGDGERDGSDGWFATKPADPPRAGTQPLAPLPPADENAAPGHANQVRLSWHATGARGALCGWGAALARRGSCL